jgi:hypothetical protein
MGEDVRKSDAFRAAAEAKDFSAIDELFAEDATFRSPVVYKPYAGIEAIKMLLGAAVQVFQDFRYTEQTETGDTATLAFSAKAGDRELEGIDLLRFGPDGKIREMAVYLRPMSGVHAMAEEMKKKLEEAGVA